MSVTPATTTAIRADREIQDAVEAELEWTPEVNAATIGVAVDDGVVSLSGEVDTYAERTAVKRAALRVRDVTAVINDVNVHPNSAFYVSETDIGKEVEQALRSATNVPDTVKAVIDGHAVTLLGEVAWDFQRRAAKRAVRYLRGVYSVDSRITLTPRVSAVDTAERIKAAILRNAQVDARTVEVSADGTKVTLSGTVRSWAERRQADLAAWSSPHVTEVYNHIVVEP
ncbi:BON domain-containing protein [Mycolicibacterium sp. 050158]|jgi:osmotically-inducible protein OsmY|uniref:BON domain-containing protein n=1 Tax=Mycolicibacterium sp. 050158 TaxID=3090602 RepID=UPI00299ED753|nr:BON domain-containing protein [Mycolicibacterium sp. 050158]MDX1890787.1 BON domain-containing protein [Mycolicibacterium sp. 050158]